jgi:hypothetical protein
LVKGLEALVSEVFHDETGLALFGAADDVVELDDVGMVQEHLDFQFTDELFRDFLFHQQLFLDHFECANKVCFLLPYFNQIITEPSTHGRTCHCPVTSLFKSLTLMVSFLSCQN